MKTYFTLFIVACQCVTTMAQDYKTPYLTKSLANDAISSVVVNTSAGGIKVSGESGEAPRVEVYIQGNNNQHLTKAEIEKRLAEDYDLNISVNGHELTATVKNKHRDDFDWKRSMSISFKIYVPQQVSTDLKTSGGGIQLDNLKGNETFSTSGGGLQIDRLSGVIHGRTSGGGIQLSNSGDNIDLVTSGGGIDAKNCTGTIKLITSGGGLELNDLNGNITAHTSGGGVQGHNIAGELITGTSGGSIDLRGMDCSLDANTSAGGIYLQMKQVGKYLKLSANAGDIDMHLPMKQGLDLDLRADNISDHFGENGFNGEWKKDHVKGTVNGGGTHVEASSSGSINLKFN
jgi:DUF4097 and DUF4098 domain-containing protein YvlB